MKNCFIGCIWGCHMLITLQYVHLFNFGLRAERDACYLTEETPENWQNCSDADLAFWMLIRST